MSPSDAVHVLAQFDVSPVCIGHALCWEGDVADSVWLLQVSERRWELTAIMLPVCSILFAGVLFCMLFCCKRTRANLMVGRPPPGGRACGA